MGKPRATKRKTGRPPNNIVPLGQVIACQRLLAAGGSFRSIARRLGLGEMTVARISAGEHPYSRAQGRAATHRRCACGSWVRRSAACVVCAARRERIRAGKPL